MNTLLSFASGAAVGAVATFFFLRWMLNRVAQSPDYPVGADESDLG